MDNQMAFQLGEITGITLLLTIFLPLVHWAARKIRRKPKKRLRDWLTSWIAGPEVFFAGIVYEMAGEGEALVILFGVALEYVGLAMLIIRASTSAVSRFRRRTPVEPSEPEPAEYLKPVPKSADEPETI